MLSSLKREKERERKRKCSRLCPTANFLFERATLLFATLNGRYPISRSTFLRAAVDTFPETIFPYVPHPSTRAYNQEKVLVLVPLERGGRRLTW